MANVVPSRTAVAAIAEWYCNGSGKTFAAVYTNGTTIADNTTLEALFAAECLDAGYRAVTRPVFNPGVGSYDGTQNRYEMPSVTVTLTPSGGDATFNAIAIVAGASTETPDAVSSADDTADTVQVTGHNASSGDRVLFVDGGSGSIPGLTLNTTFYYVAPVDADNLSVYTDSGLTTPADITGALSGTVFMVYANADTDGDFWFVSVGSTTALDGVANSRAIALNFGRGGSDVNAF